MVYVDDARHPLGQMLMCHMLADSTDELLAMADAIGLQRRWLQKQGAPDEHFDVCRSKRLEAIRRGAKEVSSRDLVVVIRRKRGAR